MGDLEYAALQNALPTQFISMIINACVYVTILQALHSGHLILSEEILDERVKPATL
jgi:hypothetical protein